jgi:hypothetical protein
VYPELQQRFQDTGFVSKLVSMRWWTAILNIYTHLSYHNVTSS